MTTYLSYLPDLLNGLYLTLCLMAASTICGFSLAILMTICSYADNRLLNKTVDGLIFFIRGTPLLVQIFLLYFGAGQFESIRDSFLWPVLREPMWCAIIALSVNTACYTTVLFRGAIASVPKNEIAACEAIGMPKWLAFRRIIFPRAFRIALPAYSNEIVIILKGTSLASTITLMDLMGVTQELISQTYDTVSLYLIAGGFYLLINLAITGLFALLARRFRMV